MWLRQLWPGCEKLFPSRFLKGSRSRPRSAQLHVEDERSAASWARLSRSRGGWPVRVRGTGFYALTPEAKAPFRIKQLLQQTRVIIPLHVKGAPQSGEVTIRPLIAGPLKVSAAIIGYTQCGENPDPAPIAFDLTVEPGAPEIVIADRFDLVKPDQIIASPKGDRRIEIYGPRYHLIDVATGALLADEIGEEPRFSPMGRFVIANVEKHFSIRDSIDGRVTRQQVADWDSLIDLAWDDRDSFLIALIHQDEGIEKGYTLESA